MRKLLLFLALALIALFAVAVVRTFQGSSAQVAPADVPEVAVDPARAAARLAEAVRIPTVSSEERRLDWRPFVRIHQHLETAFPRVHRALSREALGGGSLLYTWKGSTAQPAYLFVGHLDVVPADPTAWERDPFGGEIEGGFVHGRGSIDDKAGVTAMLEAVEHLLEEGFQPARTLVFAFGHDEETGGDLGAGRMADLLGERGLDVDAAFDEGSVISDGLVPGVASRVALVGIAEKGIVTFELTVAGEGGHASMPPSGQGAVTILAEAVRRIEDHPFPARLTEPVKAMFDVLAPELPFPRRLALSNLWLTGPLIRRQIGSTPAGNALLRTTVAATRFDAGEKNNVLPARARAVLNCRILPGDTVEGVKEHLERAVGDERVRVAVADPADAWEPSRVSAVDTESYRILAATIRGVFEDVTVAPSLVLAATDSRHYAELAWNVYRFRPFVLAPDDLPRIHGANERLPVEAYARAVRFYAGLFRNLGGEAPEPS